MNKELEIVEKTAKGNWVKVTKPEHISVGDYVRYGSTADCYAFGDSTDQSSFEARKVTGLDNHGVVSTSAGNNMNGTDDLFAWKHVNLFVPNAEITNSNNRVNEDTKVLTDKGFKKIMSLLVPTQTISTVKPVKARIVAYTGGGYGFVMKFPSRVKLQSFTLHEYTRKSDAKRAIKAICNKLNLEFVIK